METHTLPQPTQLFQHAVRGTTGEFAIAGRHVGFLLTKARLGLDGTDPERRLTEHLRPFREFPIEDLRFSELLQRDLDDHRVMAKLIPYVLGQAGQAPMFPPALVAVMPFKSGRPASSFEGQESNESFQYAGMSFTGSRWGEAFRVGKMSVSGEPYEWGFSALEWNPEACQLVVLDGQHRVMSLLAIQRTITHTWDQSMGANSPPSMKGRSRPFSNRRALEMTRYRASKYRSWSPGSRLPIRKGARKGAC